jgi:hypothetical protein
MPSMYSFKDIDTKQKTRALTNPMADRVGTFSTRVQAPQNDVTVARSILILAAVGLELLLNAVGSEASAHIQYGKCVTTTVRAP